MKRSHVTLGMIVCLMFALSIAGLYFIEPPTGAREPLLMLTGALGGSFTTVVSFWFGSSSSSARKDELLHAATPPPAEPPKA